MTEMKGDHYVANLRLLPCISFPNAYQMVNFPNPSRVHSLWLGTGANLLMLPERLWYEFLAILLRGRPLIALAMLGFIVLTSLTWLWWGIRGTAFAVGMPPSLLRSVRFLQPEACDALIELGVAKPMIFVSEAP